MSIIKAADAYEKAKKDLKSKKSNLRTTIEQYRDASIAKIESLNLENNGLESELIRILKTPSGRVIIPFLLEKGKATFSEIHAFYNKTDKGPPYATEEAIQQALASYCTQGFMQCLDDSKKWNEREFILIGISDYVTNKPAPI